MIETRDTFAQYGGQFQSKILQALLIDQQYFEKIYDILLTEYFDQKPQAFLYKVILEYYEKYKILPSVDNLDIVVRSIDDILLKNECNIVINDIKKNIISDLTYIKDKSLEFCKNQKMKKALLSSVDFLQQGRFEDIYRIIKEALNAGENSDVGHNYFEHFDKRLLMMNRTAVSTGWKVLDEILNGGWGKGELAVILAGTSIGKSWTLAHTGKGALAQGKTVLHYTFELYEYAVGSRYDAIISNVPINHIPERSEFVKKRILDFNALNGGKLIIKNYPTKTASISTLRNHINKLTHFNIIPDIIICDYADLMTSRRNYEQKRHELESIYEDLRALAGELQIPLVTASQTNRGGMDEEIVTLSTIGESFAKAQVADIIVSLSRRYEDRQKNVGKFYIAKNRAGQDNLILPVIMNTTTAQMEVLPPVDLDPKKEFGDDNVMKEVLLKEYKKMKNKEQNGKT